MARREAFIIQVRSEPAQKGYYMVLTGFPHKIVREHRNHFRKEMDIIEIKILGSRSSEQPQQTS